MLQNREDLILYPGGAAEACNVTKDGERYSLRWPQKQEFVTTAARFNATIIPMSIFGIEDSFSLMSYFTQLGGTPIIGPFLRALIDDRKTNVALVPY